MPDAVDTVVCVPDDGWRYHPKHVEQFPEINKMCSGAFVGLNQKINYAALKSSESCLSVPRIYVSYTEHSFPKS